MALPAIPQNEPKYRVFTPDAAQVYVEGAVLLVDVDGEVIEAAADPAVILGFALEDAVHVNDPEPNGRRVVAIAHPTATFWIEGRNGSDLAVTPALTNIGEAYGLFKEVSDGVWRMDIAETVATRVSIVDIDIDRKLFEVRVLAANQQVAP